ncbi:MAG: right-handed parallel beta-helix repeat-containing protein [Clostridia bacterium]|nr:right-handed parallel beta-helix repeat-containing protein [Clostridia bacterium]
MIYYVDQSARMEGCGTKERPFRHINDAARVAMPGDEVLVYPGIYREYVNPLNGGTEDNRIVYRSVEPLGAVITGAEIVTGWEHVEGTVWMKRINNQIFGSFNPYVVEVYGDWYFAPTVRHTGCVYLNDRAMYEALTMEEMKAGEVYKPSWEPEYSIYKWFPMQDGKDTVLYCNFQDKNPNEEKIEINVRRRCFFPEETGKGYITFSGFKVEKAATTWAPPAAFQDGMVGPHWSKGWIIEDCDISNSKCCGISLGKYYDPENDHYFTVKHLKSPTQMERDALCRGQYHGWLKEKVGGHIVRRNHIHHCEQTGIVGRMGAVFSLIEDNHIHNINNMQELGGAEISGIKLHAAIDVTMRRNHIHHCTMGIWCDWQAQGTRISQNFLHHNERPSFCEWAEGGMESQDIFVEVSHGPTLIDNNILLSQVSLRIATQGVAMVHNLMMGTFTFVGGGTGDRYTPYHIRHRTEVAGFNTFVHGDDRFYNNIFVQGFDPAAEIRRGEPSEKERICGTWQFDEYPTYDEWISWFDLDVKRPDMMKLDKPQRAHLPVWSEGNVYLNGAKPWKHEQHHLVADGARVELVEEDGKYTLKTNVYGLLQGFETNTIHSDVLGCAFQPEQRFENNDGSPIVFDRDFFGSHRGIAPLPGPFAAPIENELFIWEDER